MSPRRPKEERNIIWLPQIETVQVKVLGSKPSWNTAASWPTSGPVSGLSFDVTEAFCDKSTAGGFDMLICLSCLSGVVLSPFSEHPSVLANSWSSNGTGCTLSTGSHRRGFRDLNWARPQLLLIVSSPQTESLHWEHRENSIYLEKVGPNEKLYWETIFNSHVLFPIKLRIILTSCGTY